MVPGKYLASTEAKKLIAVLKNELDKKAERFLQMNLIVKEIIAKKQTDTVDCYF